MNIQRINNLNTNKNTNFCAFFVKSENLSNFKKLYPDSQYKLFNLATEISEMTHLGIPKHRLSENDGANLLLKLKNKIKNGIMLIALNEKKQLNKLTEGKYKAIKRLIKKAHEITAKDISKVNKFEEKSLSKINKKKLSKINK